MTIVYHVCLLCKEELVPVGENFCPKCTERLEQQREKRKKDKEIRR